MKKDYQPDKNLVEQFSTLEKKINEALELIGRLRQENRSLREKLNELEKLHANAVAQLNIIIDKIDSLL